MYEHFKVHAHLSWEWQKFYKLVTLLYIVFVDLMEVFPGMIKKGISLITGQTKSFVTDLNLDLLKKDWKVNLCCLSYRNW